MIKKQKAELRKSILSNRANTIFLISSLVLAAIIVFLSISLYSNFQIEPTKIQIEYTVKPDSLIHIEVMNGCGVAGVADGFTNFLRKNNFDVIQMGNYYSFDIEKTLVVDRTGNKKNAQLVATSLGLSEDVVISQTNKNYFLDVSVIIGKDFNQLNLY